MPSASVAEAVALGLHPLALRRFLRACQRRPKRSFPALHPGRGCQSHDAIDVNASTKASESTAAASIAGTGRRNWGDGEAKRAGYRLQEFLGRLRRDGFRPSPAPWCGDGFLLEAVRGCTGKLGSIQMLRPEDEDSFASLSSLQLSGAVYLQAEKGLLVALSGSGGSCMLFLLLRSSLPCCRCRQGTDQMQSFTPSQRVCMNSAKTTAYCCQDDAQPRMHAERGLHVAEMLTCCQSSQYA